MNLEYLTPSMWETLRKFDYDQLMLFVEMFEDVEV